MKHIPRCFKIEFCAKTDVLVARKIYLILHSDQYLGNCLCLDDTRKYANHYNHQPIDAGNAHEKDYFHVSAPDFNKDLVIGFSNGYTGHGDKKLEIILGGGSDKGPRTLFGIRPGNAGTTVSTARTFSNSNEYNQVRNNFIVQVTDGNIALYSADSDGNKKSLIVEWTNTGITKSYYKTLTVTGGFGGSGTVRVRGVCRN